MVVEIKIEIKNGETVAFVDGLCIGVMSEDFTTLSEYLRWYFMGLNTKTEEVTVGNL